MQTLTTSILEKWYFENFEENLSGLRILYDDIQPLINSLKVSNSIIGHSTNGIPIHKLEIGNGPKRILIWSQMHGNESTGTKALFDLFKFFENPKELVTTRDQILKSCTIIIIPMLNPDGAISYTRENGQGIDLNRDAVSKSGTESKILRGILDSFNPEFCFNLHDQRTIFNVKGTKNPATISFLAPSEEITRAITTGRTETMSVIVAMNNLLQQFIPNHIGRYTDEFYPTATGDNFQKLGHNTILIEAGHFKDDYSREQTRKFNFYAMLQGLDFLASTNDYTNYKSYFEIPNNDSLFFDIIYKNALIDEDSSKRITDIGILFKYRVEEGGLVKYNHIEQQGELSKSYGHVEIDLEGSSYKM